MKKKLVSLFALMFMTTLGAHADIDINETNFPDRKFRRFLLAQTYGADGMVLAVVQQYGYAVGSAHADADARPERKPSASSRSGCSINGHRNAYKMSFSV